MSLGIYISVPFCRTKCSFCNFASGVFSRAIFDRYVDQVCTDIAAAEAIASAEGGKLERRVDSIYLGGGTPSVLAPDQLQRLFRTLRDNFEVEQAAEITVECAPGTITEPVLEALLECGVDRVSLGVQSFVDKECSSVGRLHNRAVTLDDVARLRAAGIGNIGIDLIAGLPHQTADRWDYSLAETIATGVPHVSVYMLEVDEDSRLGSELLAGGTRYHAHFVPDEDLTADLYLTACERLEQGGIHQYEISNFARSMTHEIGLRESRHNAKYWNRQPYLGFGVDAHSMLLADDALAGHGNRGRALRYARFTGRIFGDGEPCAANAERTKQLLSSRTLVDSQTAMEESFFLGLRLNRGVSLTEIADLFGPDAAHEMETAVAELIEAGLLGRDQRHASG